MHQETPSHCGVGPRRVYIQCTAVGCQVMHVRSWLFIGGLRLILTSNLQLSLEQLAASSVCRVQVMDDALHAR